MYSNGSEGVVKVAVEATPGTLVTPSVTIPYLDGTIVRPEPDRKKYMGIAGAAWGSLDYIQKGRVLPITFKTYATPNILKYIAAATWKHDSHSLSDSAHSDTYVAGDSKSLSMEIKSTPNLSVRLWGIQFNTIKLAVEDATWVISADGWARGHFYMATLEDALSGASTSAKLSMKQVLNPTKGITDGSSVVILDDTNTEKLLANVVVTDDQNIAFDSQSITAAAGSKVYLRPQTASFTLNDPFILPNTFTGVGTSLAAATANATADNTLVVGETPSWEFSNNLTPFGFNLERGAGAFLRGAPSAKVSLETLYKTDDYEDDQRVFHENEKVATYMKSLTGEYATGGTTQYEMDVVFNKLKMENTPRTDPTVMAEGKKLTYEYEAFHDTGDNSAFSITIVDTVDGSAL